MRQTFLDRRDRPDDFGGSPADPTTTYCAPELERVSRPSDISDAEVARRALGPPVSGRMMAAALLLLAGLGSAAFAFLYESVHHDEQKTIGVTAIQPPESSAHDAPSASPAPASIPATEPRATTPTVAAATKPVVAGASVPHAPAHPGASPALAPQRPWGFGAADSPSAHARPKRQASQASSAFPPEADAPAPADVVTPTPETATEHPASPNTNESDDTSTKPALSGDLYDRRN
jgi:hypothetical protein